MKTSGEKLRKITGGWQYTVLLTHSKTFLCIESYSFLVSHSKQGVWALETPIFENSLSLEHFKWWLKLERMQDNYFSFEAGRTLWNGKHSPSIWKHLFDFFFFFYTIIYGFFTQDWKSLHSWAQDKAFFFALYLWSVMIFLWIIYSVFASIYLYVLEHFYCTL